MRINWANIFGLMLFVFLIYLFVKSRPFLESIFEQANYGYYPQDPLLRVLIIGLLCFTAVAVARIISRK